MPDRYATPAKGSSDWDVPLNDNFSTLDIDVEHRGTTDPDTAGVSPAAGAKFLDTSTGEIYTADGSSWTLQWDLGAIGSGGGSGDVTTVDGVSNRRQHVGPLHHGSYHTGVADNDHTSGIVIQAENLHIESTVVDSDLSAISKTDLTVELRHYDGGAANTTVVDSATNTLSGGPERIPLGFNVPASGSGDTNDEYVLCRAPVTSGEVIPLRRIADTNFGTAEYDTHTYTDPPIDFIRGTAANSSGDFGSEAYYYYFFDLLVGSEATRVDSPWSTDVDEIYMRPRDPAEEFGSVSPRSIWFDTSGT